MFTEGLCFHVLRFKLPINFIAQVVNKYSTLRVTEHHLVSSLIKLFDCYLVRLVEGAELKGKSETELTPLFEGMFFFSCIWSIGSVCDSEAKKIFDMVFNELLRGTGNFIYRRLVNMCCVWVFKVIC